MKNTRFTVPKIALAFYAAVLQAQTTGPLIPQGPKLLGNNPINTVNGGASQGSAVALSADGNTALVGGDNDNGAAGAAWVFERSNGVWSQQQKLTTGDAVTNFGISVGLSGDGNTAIVGCNCQTNTVWVYTRFGGVWGPATRLSPTGAVHFAQIGFSVALSQDGTTALIGGPGDNNGVGAAWVFTRSGGVWTQEGSKMIGTGGSSSGGQGYSVALSADGNSAVVGGNADGNMAWIFTRNNGAWGAGTRLIPGTGEPFREGSAVAISGDGNTVMVGGPYGIAGAWVFARNGSSWSLQAGPLAGSNTTKFSAPATSVALNEDGNIAIIGGPGDGDAFLFRRSNGNWSQVQQLSRSEVQSAVYPALFGNSAAISADTTTILIGSPQANPPGLRSEGGGWVFYSPPASITAAAGTPQTGFLGAEFPTGLEAMVKNTLGYSAPGVAVTFTAPASGPSGAFAGGSNAATIMTNAAGIGTALIAANQVVGGPYTVSATVSGVSGEADFALTNLPPTVNITLQTSPPNLQVSLDGARAVAAPLTQALVPLTTHTIAAPSPQTSGGVQYSFVSWSDSQPLSHSITVPLANATYTATFAPTPAITNVMNAATNAPPPTGGGLPQGGFVSIYGTNLGPAATIYSPTLPLKSNLGGVTVSVTPPGASPLTAYLIYVSPTQINAILPSAAPIGQANITVTYNGVTSQPAPIQVAAAGFGIFTFNYGTGPACAVDLESSSPVVGSGNAAHPGNYIELYGTGLGAVNVPDNQAPGGAISPLGISVQVIVGGQTVSPVYAGRTPQFPAEDQIDFQLPAGVATGCSVPVVVVVNGLKSNAATLAIAGSGKTCSN